MKTISAAIFTTLFLIAPHAVSMTTGGVFSSANSRVQISASDGEVRAKKPRKQKKARASGKAGKGVSGVQFFDGSAESTRERERRLMRECKGRSNSGVCEGYTR